MRFESSAAESDDAAAKARKDEIDVYSGNISGFVVKLGKPDLKCSVTCSFLSKLGLR